MPNKMKVTSSKLTLHDLCRNEWFMRILFVGLCLLSAVVFILYWAVSIPHTIEISAEPHVVQTTEFNSGIFVSGLVESVVVLLVACILSQCLSWRKRNLLTAQHMEESVVLHIVGRLSCFAGVLSLLFSIVSLLVDIDYLTTEINKSVVFWTLCGGGPQTAGLLECINAYGWNARAVVFFLLVGCFWFSVSVGMTFLLIAEVLSSVCADSYVSQWQRIHNRLKSVRNRFSSHRGFDTVTGIPTISKTWKDALAAIDKEQMKLYREEEMHWRQIVEIEDGLLRRIAETEALEPELVKSAEHMRREASRELTAEAQNLFSENKFEESLEKLDEALRVWPKNAEAKTLRKSVFPKSSKGIACRKKRIRLVVLFGFLGLSVSVAVFVIVVKYRRMDAERPEVREPVGQMVDVSEKDCKMCK